MGYFNEEAVLGGRASQTLPGNHDNQLFKWLISCFGAKNLSSCKVENF